MNFIEFASKAQEELNKQRLLIEDEGKIVSERDSSLSRRSVELDKRESDIAKKESELADKKLGLDKWEVAKKKEEQIQQMFDEAVAKNIDSAEKLKQARFALDEATAKIQEMEKREKKQSERESSYREEIKAEFMNRFMGVK